MIRRSLRFHGHGSLRGVYSRGQTLRGAQLNLKYIKRNDAQPSRIAVVVSRKVSKSAVVRNRIRRRIYEIVRENHTVTGVELVFTVFSAELATIEHDKLRALITGLVEKSLSNSGLSSPSNSGRGIVKTKGSD